MMALNVRLNQTGNNIHGSSPHCNDRSVNRILASVWLPEAAETSTVTSSTTHTHSHPAASANQPIPPQIRILQSGQRRAGASAGRKHSNAAWRFV